MPRVVVAPRARQDVVEAASWYDGQRDGLGDEFVRAVADAVGRLAHDPGRFPGVCTATCVERRSSDFPTC